MQLGRLLGYLVYTVLLPREVRPETLEVLSNLLFYDSSCI